MPFSCAGSALRARLAHIVLAIAALAAPAMLLGQTDEIQVYDAAIAEPGVFNLMVHMNFTPIGRTTPVYPGAIIANDSFQTTAEWAYGVTPWFEQGLYLPVTTPHSTNYGATIDGFKIRELFVRPHADDHKFFYGVNFEFSVNHHFWESRTITSEVRPIVGLHLKPWDFIFNPILDTDYTGGVRNLQFNPATRVAYNLNDRWAVAAEEYDGFGTLQTFVPVGQQFHEVWAVMDHNNKIVNIEAGVGVGYTGGGDRLTFKLMVSRDLNKKREPRTPEAKPPQ
ncbi:MAG TPA: hypothetical protein VK789_23095 [Bryobacteraceae bacterium]|nr:hypothetical protein [Bryobacteraceae bacterium]